MIHRMARLREWRRDRRQAVGHVVALIADREVGVIDLSLGGCRTTDADGFLADRLLSESWGHLGTILLKLSAENSEHWVRPNTTVVWSGQGQAGLVFIEMCGLDAMRLRWWLGLSSNDRRFYARTSSDTYPDQRGASAA